MNSWTATSVVLNDYHKTAIGDSFQHYHEALNVEMPTGATGCYLMIGHKPGSHASYPNGLLEGWVFHKGSGPLG